MSLEVLVADICALQGLLTLIIGIMAFLLMPAGPCQTKSWFRGKDGWFTEQYVAIFCHSNILIKSLC